MIGKTNIQGGGLKGLTATPADVKMGMTFTTDSKNLQTGTMNLTNLKSENIKRGVTIDGVAGSVDPLDGGEIYEFEFINSPPTITTFTNVSPEDAEVFNKCGCILKRGVRVGDIVRDIIYVTNNGDYTYYIVEINPLQKSARIIKELISLKGQYLRSSSGGYEHRSDRPRCVYTSMSDYDNSQTNIGLLILQPDLELETKHEFSINFTRPVRSIEFNIHGILDGLVYYRATCKFKDDKYYIEVIGVYNINENKKQWEHTKEFYSVRPGYDWGRVCNVLDIIGFYIIDDQKLLRINGITGERTLIANILTNNYNSQFMSELLNIENDTGYLFARKYPLVDNVSQLHTIEEVLIHFKIRTNSTSVDILRNINAGYTKFFDGTNWKWLGRSLSVSQIDEIISNRTTKSNFIGVHYYVREVDGPPNYSASWEDPIDWGTIMYGIEDIVSMSSNNLRQVLWISNHICYVWFRHAKNSYNTSIYMVDTKNNTKQVSSEQYNTGISGSGCVINRNAYYISSGCREQNLFSQYKIKLLN